MFIKILIFFGNFRQIQTSIVNMTKKSRRQKDNSKPHDRDEANAVIVGAMDIQKQGKLYYLNSLKSENVSSKSLEEWHRVLGHCNVKDILSLEFIYSSKLSRTCDRKPD